MWPLLLLFSFMLLLPGVPAEMKEMWEQTVAPAIRGLAGPAMVIRHRRIKCFGVGESDLEQMLPDLIRRGRYPEVGITISGATITSNGVTTLLKTDLERYRPFFEKIWKREGN